MITKKTRALLAIITPALSFASVVVLSQAQPVSALPQTFTVTNTNDSGSGSLRQAITDANSNGNPGDQDIIEFDISGLETKRINLTSSIDITESALIDGYTQGNATQNTAIFPDPPNGLIRVELLFMDDAAINITADNVGLAGLSISRDYSASGSGGSINIDGADNFSLKGSYLGTDFSGLMFSAEADSGNDIHLDIFDSQNALIGGPNPADRNIFTYCSGKCIVAGGTNPGSSSGLEIKGNYIGLASDGITVDQFESLGVELYSGADDATIGGPSLTEGNMFVGNNNGSILASNVSGLNIYSNRLYHNKQYRITTPTFTNLGTITLLGVINSQIGSSTPETSNFIAGSWSVSLFIDDSEARNSSNISIEGNTFGYSYDGLSAFTNKESAVQISGSSEDILIKSNTIHHSTNIPEPSGNASGVLISESSNDVSIIQNSIYNNAGLGIQIDGGISNDNLDSDTGANDYLNYPEWYSQQESGGDTIVDFTADLPAGDYRVEFFSNTVGDPSSRGEGEVYLGYTMITSTGIPANFTHTLTGITGATNLALTATEIDGGSPNGFGATSQFGGEGVEYVLPKNISIEKTLDDSQNYAAGNTVQYTITLTNTGDNSIDLTTLDGSGVNPLADNLFVDILAPGMTFNSVISGEVSCSPLGLISDLDPSPSWANHQNYSLLACPYSGSETLFQPDDTISVTISIDLALDFNLGLANTVIPGWLEGDTGEDVLAACFTSANQPSATNDVIDCLLADNSGNADIAQNEVPYPDLTITKTLTDPEDFVQNGQVTYTVTISNDGTLPLDLSLYDGSYINPLAGSLFSDLSPPDMTFLSDSSSDVTCSAAPANLATLAGPIFANHGDYGALFCTYSGTDDYLDPAEQISVDITFQISNDSDLSYTNYATPGWAQRDPGTTVASDCLNSSAAPEATQDTIDCLITDTSGEADLAWAGAPADIDISQSFSAPNGVSPGSAVSYTYTFTNNGPGNVSLPWYNISSPLFANIFPGEDLTLVNSTSSVQGIGCIDVGPGSAILLGTFAEDHTSHNLVVCSYVGTDNIALTAGQSVIVTINATVNDGSDGQFTNYLFHAATPSSPESASMYQLLFSATGDQLDTTEGYPMFSRVSYPLGSSPEGGSNGSGLSGGLSDTGESIRILVALGIMLMLAAGITVIVSKKNTADKNK